LVSVLQVSLPEPSSPPHAVCPATHHILLDIITWIVFDDEYQSWSASSYNLVSSENHEVPHHTIWWAVKIMKCLIIQFGEQWKSWSASSYNLVSSANHEVLIIQFYEHTYHEVLIIQFGANLEFLIIQFGEQCRSWSSYHTIWLAWKHEVLVIQFVEQCKSWSSYHTIWWTVQIFKFISYNLVSSANPEVLIIQIDEQCKSWSSYHTIWWAWKS
jgi:hypothetical protein